MPVTSDFAWLNELYGASDLMVHATDFGESFGYTLGEAMATGLPLIVRTTPWGDSAQVELVENGCNGYVCASTGEMARRWTELAENSRLRRTMGESGRARIQTYAHLETELDILEEVLAKVKTRRTGPRLQQRNQAWLNFAREFRTREWRISESPRTHPLDYCHARIYSAYRSLRMFTRIQRDRWIPKG